MDSIKKLTELFSKFPTIGQRTASRFVFYLLRLPKEQINELTQAIQDLKNNISLCGFCFNPHENTNKLCPTCQNPARNRQLLCVVEKESDFISIENTKKYNGLYFIVGGMLHFKKSDLDNLRLDELKKRVINPADFGLTNTIFSEIIIATNPTPEGKIISGLVEKTLKDLPILATPEMLQAGLPHRTTLKITRLAQGLPVGGELEYADEETLESAFEGRK